jgi:hypothetical protein
LLTEQKAVGSSEAILCSARAAMPFDTAVHGAKKVRSRISLKPENFAKQHLLFCFFFFYFAIELQQAAYGD